MYMPIPLMSGMCVSSSQILSITGWVLFVLILVIINNCPLILLPSNCSICNMYNSTSPQDMVHAQRRHLEFKNIIIYF